jgi:transposase
VQKVSEIYKISRKVISDWKKLKSESGDIKAKEGHQRGHRNIIKDADMLKKFLEQSPNKTGVGLARGWSEGISTSAMNHSLRKFGFSYKKNFLSPKTKPRIE